jgi:hypothetical protein
MVKLTSQFQLQDRAKAYYYLHNGFLVSLTSTNGVFALESLRK